MSQSDVPVHVRLERVVDLLARGDWRSAKEDLRRGGDAGGQRAVVDVMACLRRVANCQWLQCSSGDVEAALRELERAVPVLLRLGARRAGAGRLVVPAEPAHDRDLPHLVWSTTRLVAREHADLEDLRLVFGDISRGARELVYAAAEHLTWVEFDPWTVRVHEHDQELLGLDDEAYARFRTLNPRDISARATNLRHLAAVRKGTVASRTWHRMGGYGAVREAALLVLVGDKRARDRTELPVRLGRLRAVEYAKGLRDDTVA